MKTEYIKTTERTGIVLAEMAMNKRGLHEVDIMKEGDAMIIDGGSNMRRVA